MFRKNAFRISILTLVLFLAGDVVMAADYKLLESIPGFFNSGDVVDLPQLLSAIYKFGIWTVGIAAMFMIVIGGFMYVSSAGNTSTAGSAKNIITDALIGLVVAMAAYLFLYVINPDLVKTSLMTEVSPSVEAYLYGRGTPSNEETKKIIEQLGVNDLADEILKSGISVSGSGDCKDAGGNAVTPRSNLEELKAGKPMTACNSSCKTSGTPCTQKIFASGTRTMLKAILESHQEGKKFTITSIAGGQHTGKSIHYSGLAADIVPASSNLSQWNDYVAGFISKSAFPSQTFCDKNGYVAKKNGVFDCTGTTKNGETANHIHIDFRNS
ncbi:MAG: hypothetical protein ACD_11C00116G0021 [uncultured bacterium]|nr:MAG: hypothetical protein ACD_11C00116G0021 [uncultured bacterium]